MLPHGRSKSEGTVGRGSGCVGCQPRWAYGPVGQLGPGCKRRGGVILEIVLLAGNATAVRILLLLLLLLYLFSCFSTSSTVKPLSLSCFFLNGRVG